MEQKRMKQTTLRVDAALLRKARFYLDCENKSVVEFLVEQLEDYVQEHEERERAGDLDTATAHV